MRPLQGHRQRGQIVVLAPLALVAMIGMLSLVIDVGRYYLARQEAQKVADAAALAAIMTWPDNQASTQTVADSYAEQNSQVLRAVCALPAGAASPETVGSFTTVRLTQPDGTTLPAPALKVQVACVMSVIPGTILWAGPAPTFPIAVDATAAQGCVDPAGFVLGYTNPCPGTPPYRYGARLIA